MNSRPTHPPLRLSPWFPWPAALIGVTAFAAILPMFFLGVPSGHDFEFHLDSWIEILGQWRQGILYPRWASLAHYGYGEARFLFYPPASWILGASLGSVIPWRLVPGVFTWLTLTGAGLSMFFLARRWFSQSTALFVSAVYAANPYHLVIVYWRSAYAELLAAVLLPLLLLFVSQLAEQGRRAVIPLSLVVAAAWLTNAPSAVMVNYSLALLVLVVAIVQKSPRTLVYGAIAVVVGAALAAFYLVPAAYEEKWVNIAEVLSPGVRPSDNFLFTVINDPEHNRFNLLVSIVAVSEIVVVTASALLSRKGRNERTALWWTSAAWTGAASVLMLPFTFIFWEHLPKLRFVQLPWRWLLCLNVGFALLLPLGWRRWTSRIAVFATLLIVLVVVGYKVQPPWWDHAADITEIRDNIREGRGYEGTDEYVPAGADPYEIKQNGPLATVEHDGKAEVQIHQWSANSKILNVNVPQASSLVLRLFNYPAWKVTVNSSVVNAKTREATGQLIIPLQAGENSVQIAFTRTWDRTVGGAISLLTLVGMAAAGFVTRRRAVGR